MGELDKIDLLDIYYIYQENTYLFIYTYYNIYITRG